MRQHFFGAPLAGVALWGDISMQKIWRSQMKVFNVGNTFKRTLLAIVVAMWGLTHTLNALADDDEDREDRYCTNASVKGSYGFSELGWTEFQDQGLVPAADVGVVSTDGHGSWTGSETLNVAGQVLRDTFVGTYTVSPDCTGTAIFTVTFENGVQVQRTLSFVVTDDSIHILSTSPGSVLVGTATKQ